MSDPKNLAGIIDDADGENSDEKRYLLFRLGTELYGTPLLGVREIVEPQQCKPIPNTVKHFTGVINVRGQIVSVVNLRLRFSIQNGSTEGQALIVFDTVGGLIAAQVDRVEAVLSISEKDIDKDTSVSTQVPLEFFMGIGKHGEDLVSIVDLKRVLSADELVSMRGSRLAG